MSSIGGSCTSLATQLFDQATVRAQNQHNQQQNEFNQGTQVSLVAGVSSVSEDNKGINIDVFV